MSPKGRADICINIYVKLVHDEKEHSDWSGPNFTKMVDGPLTNSSCKILFLKHRTKENCFLLSSYLTGFKIGANPGLA